MTATELPGRVDLTEQGIHATGAVYRNPTTALLYTHALARGEGKLGEGGPLVVDTGSFTGRSPKDKFLVDEPSSTDRIWWGDVNQKLSEDHYELLREKVASHLAASEALYVVDAWAGADRAHRIGVRVITAHPYHALFARTMFIDLRPEEQASFSPQAVVSAHARPGGGSRRGRHAQRHVHRPASRPHRAARRRHVLRGRDQEVDLHGDERPVAARGRLPDALLGERRRRTVMSRSSSGCRARARRRSPPTPSDR